MTAEDMRRNVEITLAHGINLSDASGRYRLHAINRTRLE
jgi:hypothetical protein